MRADPHLGSPVGPHLAKTDVALCLPTSGQIWEAVQPSHTPRNEDRAIDKATTRETAVGESLVPVCSLKEIQVLLVPLLETLQQHFVLRPLQLQHLDLGGTQGRRSWCCPGYRVPKAPPGS